MVTLSVGIDEDNIRKLHGESTNNKFFLSRPFLFPLQEQSVIFKALITKLQRPRLMTGFLSEGVNVISKNRLARYFSMHFIVNINCNFFFESVADSNRNLKKRELTHATKWRSFFCRGKSCFRKADNEAFFREARQDSFNLSSFIIQRSETRSLRDVYLTKGRSCRDTWHLVILAFLFEIRLR